MLDQEQGGEEKSAEAEREDHGHGLVGGAIEVGQPLAPEIREAVGKPFPQAAHEPERREPESGDGQPDAGRERASPKQVPGLHDGHQDDAQHEGQGGEDRPTVTLRPGRGLIGSAKRRQRRNPSDAEQGNEGERHGGPESEAHAGGERRPRDRGSDRDGQEFAEDAWERLLDRQAEGRAQRTPDEADPGGLDEKEGEHLPAAAAEAPEHRHGVELLPDEDVDGAGDAETAEEEGDEGHESEEASEAVERVAEIALLILDRAHPYPVGAEAGAEGIGDGLDLGARRQAEIGVVLRARAESEEASFADQCAGNEHPRPEGGGDSDVAGHVVHRADDRQPEGTERERIADGGAEGGQEGGVDQGDAFGLQPGPSGGGRCRDLAEERPAAARPP